jgi:hypothetical protein
MSDFQRIKNAAEEQKRLKAHGEARIQSLDEEKSRILADVSKDTGQMVASKEEAQAVSDTMKSDIEQQIMSMKDILDKEGVSY